MGSVTYKCLAEDCGETFDLMDAHIYHGTEKYEQAGALYYNNESFVECPHCYSAETEEQLRAYREAS